MNGRRASVGRPCPASGAASVRRPFRAVWMCDLVQSQVRPWSGELAEQCGARHRSGDLAERCVRDVAERRFGGFSQGASVSCVISA